MRRRLARLAAVPAALLPLALVLPLAIPASAGAVTGKFFAGTAIDGPSADIESLSDLDVARDGTGALTYVKSVDGVDHVFVSRLVDGAFQAPEQLDVGLGGTGSQPVVAASDGGRLVVAFVNGGSVYAAVRPAGAPGWAATQQIAGTGSDPDVDMSINGVAYLTWTTSGDVDAARLERNGTAFNVIPGPLDIDPANTAGTGTGRPKVAVAADGIATVVWGEAGHVWGRRIFELRLSTAPQDLGADADAPDISSEDDSSFAWVVFRQGGLVVARRLVGSEFDPPITLEGAEGAAEPQVAINGRGVGYAGIGGLSSGAAYGAVLKDDVFNPAVVIGGGFGMPAPVPAVAESGDGVIAYQQGDASGGSVIDARPYHYVPASRAVTQPGPEASVTDPALGPTDAARGLLAAGDRAGDVAVAFVQGNGSGSQIVAGAFDRAPGAFRASTTTKWRKYARPPLKWGTSFELWGPLTYQVQIDGVPVAQSTSTAVKVPTRVKDGVHRWRVVAIDLRGQTTATPTRNLRVDATPPKVSFRLSGAHKRGALIKVAVKATDASGSKAKASGLKTVRIRFGDGSRAITSLRAAHRYGRSGHVTVSVTAGDRAGNVITVKRRITIRK